MTTEEMNTTDRAAKVLQQIDDALALAEKATPGPWKTGRTCYGNTAVFPDSNSAIATFGTYKQGERPHFLHNFSANAAFIAASRTLLPASLRCLKTAIEGLTLIAFYPHGGRDFSTTGDQAFASLTTLCDQWEAGQ